MSRAGIGAVGDVWLEERRRILAPYLLPLLAEGAVAKWSRVEREAGRPRLARLASFAYDLGYLEDSRAREFARGAVEIFPGGGLSFDDLVRELTRRPPENLDVLRDEAAER